MKASKMAALPAVDLFANISHAKKKALLKLYMRCGRMEPCCRQLGIDHSHHYYWMRTDPAYVEAFAQAKEYSIQHLEDIAMARATDEVKPSDLLLIFLLKAARPEKYRDSVKRDERSDVSELLKAVLLELVDRQHARDGATPVVDWAPVPPEVREPPRLGLPAPPDVEEDT
jgi:hypothetical protein